MHFKIITCQQTLPTNLQYYYKVAYTVWQLCTWKVTSTDIGGKWLKQRANVPKGGGGNESALAGHKGQSYVRQSQHLAPDGKVCHLHHDQTRSLHGDTLPLRWTTYPLGLTRSPDHGQASIVTREHKNDGTQPRDMRDWNKPSQSACSSARLDSADTRNDTHSAILKGTWKCYNPNTQTSFAWNGYNRHSDPDVLHGQVQF
jgi:hypothetical protein